MAVAREIADISKMILKVICMFYVPLLIVLTLVRFPYDTDATARTSPAHAAGYYDAEYGPAAQRRKGLDYEEIARRAAVESGVEGRVRRFAQEYGLSNKRVLEVGSGRGYLQDIVPDYTGLDLSAAVADRYHKPFVAASATAMPFPDRSFDAIWSVWVLEHIPEPEQALREMRRVLKPGGLLLLMPAWDCNPWAADGLEVRPYKDLNWRGAVVKASIPFQRFIDAWLPITTIRRFQYQASRDGTRLRFHRLTPNYDIYWQPDSDAVVSISRREVSLWFSSRGDQCLNCSGSDRWETIIRIHG